MKIGIIGHGNVGKKLAALFSNTGHDVFVGKRNPEGAQNASGYRIGSIEQATAHGDTVLLAIPFVACEAVLSPLASAFSGKIVIDATNPLKEDWSPLSMGEQNSAGESIARLLPSAHVVKAFNSVFADVMTGPLIGRAPTPITAFLAGDDFTSVDRVTELVRSIGMSPIKTGPLMNARYLEGMAHLNIAIAVGQQGGTGVAFVYSDRTAA
jgi:8-hydroxy-5-deazaflavin:NADPH oxidoreductase